MECQGESTAASQGLTKWQKRSSAPDMVPVDGEKVLLLGVVGTSLTGCRCFVWAGISHPLECTFPADEQGVFQCFFSRFRGYSCICSSCTGVRHRLSSELSPGEGRHSKWCFCFLLLKKQKKEKLYPPKGTQTHTCVSACPGSCSLHPCLDCTASLGLAAAALPSHYAQAAPGTRNHSAQGIPQATPLSCEMIPGQLR